MRYFTVIVFVIKDGRASFFDDLQILATSQFVAELIGLDWGYNVHGLTSCGVQAFACI